MAEYIEDLDESSNFKSVFKLLPQYEPNIKQHLVARVAVSLTNSGVTRQLWHIPSGHGKSRTILALGIYFKEHGFNDIVVAFSNEFLLKRDKTFIEKLWKHAKIDARFVNVGQYGLLDSGIFNKEHTVYIMDEVDQLLTDARIMPIQSCIYIGLTATPTDFLDNTDTHQQSILDLWGYKVLRTGDESHHRDPDVVIEYA